MVKRDEDAYRPEILSLFTIICITYDPQNKNMGETDIHNSALCRDSNFGKEFLLQVLQKKSYGTQAMTHKSI